MATGESLVMRYMDRDLPVQPREKRDRDRSLPGKKRIKARKAR
jgi:hypothetical protein